MGKLGRIECGRLGWCCAFLGTVGSEEERRALRVIAENISGVRGIEDHSISGPRYLAPLFPAI